MAKELKDGQWNHEWLAGAFDDPATAIITCCLPCVSYGQLADRVHGGDCLKHGGLFCLSSYCCLSGLFAGPTRRTIRDAYKLPQNAPELGPDDASKLINQDCILHTIPCIGCFVLCQEMNEVKDRNPTAPLGPAPEPFKAKPAQTTAPAQAEMGKDKPAEKPAAAPTTEAPPATELTAGTAQ